MRVRPGRVGRFHGNKGVHRTGIAKTERRTPVRLSSAYAFPLLAVLSKVSRSLSLPFRGYVPRHLLRNILLYLCSAACYPLVSAP